MRSYTPKIVLLSAVYFIVVIVLLLTLDLFLDWFLDFVLGKLNWFNAKKIWIKILILILGGYVLLAFVMSLVSIVAALISKAVYSKLPKNMFTMLSAMILCVANAIWYIILIWRSVNHFNFWVVIELLVLSIFIWSMNFTLAVEPKAKPNKY